MSYQPRSTNPYIMEKKLNECVGGGGFDPSVLKEIQTEISILGSANAAMAQDITDIKGSLNSINADLIDIKGSLNSLTAPYSTTPHKTGRKWSDGRDEWEKTLVFENTIEITTSGTNIETSSDVDVPIEALAVDPTYKSATPLKTGVTSGTVKAYAFGSSFTAETVIIKYLKAVEP